MTLLSSDAPRTPAASKNWLSYACFVWSEAAELFWKSTELTTMTSDNCLITVPSAGLLQTARARGVYVQIQTPHTADPQPVTHGEQHFSKQ